MACKCQIRVTSGGKYCCDLHGLYVRSNCIGQIKFSNLPEVLIEYEITPDNWIPAETPMIAGDGCVSLFKPGQYRFTYDCSGINNTVAPEEDAIGLCYECCKVDDYSQMLLSCFIELKAQLVASDDTAALAEIIEALESICAKLLDLINNIGDLSELCDKLEKMIESLAELCGKIEEGFDQMLEALESVKESLSTLCEKIEKLIEINAQQAETLEEIKELLTCPPQTPQGVVTTAWN